MADAIPQGHPSRKADHRHEGSDINYGNILKIALFMLALAFVIHVTLWYQMLLFRATPQKPSAALSPLALGPQNPPLPHVQEDQPADLARYRAVQEALLGGLNLDQYQWVDRNRRIVRIPINRAMELYLRENGANPRGPAPVLSLPEREGPPMLTPHAPLTP